MFCLALMSLADTGLGLINILKEKPNTNLSNSHGEGGDGTAFSTPQRVLAGQGSQSDLIFIIKPCYKYNKYQRDKKKKKICIVLECDHSSEYTSIRRQREAGYFITSLLPPHAICLFSFTHLMKIRVKVRKINDKSQNGVTEK